MSQMQPPASSSETATTQSTQTGAAPITPDSRPPTTATATFCATLVDQWSTLGVTSAFISPGSRSTPLALALATNPSIEVNVFHDERSASFAALGHGLTTGQPAILLCTSGTAAAHFHAAVIEADLSCVPILVCTADRPPELWDVGASQTIDQTELYGKVVRAFHQPGPPEDSKPNDWRPLATTSHREATGQRPGPVHLNLSFRDPLVGEPGELPPAANDSANSDASQANTSDAAVSQFAASQLLERCFNPDGSPKKGVIIAGRGQSEPAAVAAFASHLNWPVLADHRSGCRFPGKAIRHFDGLLRSAEFATSHQPEVILRLGELVASKAVSQWIAATKADVIAATPWGRRIDPEAVLPFVLPQANLIEAAVEALPADPLNPANHGWLDSWTTADEAANRVITEILTGSDGLADPHIAREALRRLPKGAALVVSSSMPVRDLEWFGENRNDVAVYANRGANGIDGVVSTAIGIALTGVRTVCLIGDVAFLHDIGSLVALAQRDLDLTIVVTDNDGGGIFSFLPQHTLLESERYEQLFGTPHGTDLEALVTANRLPVLTWEAAVQDTADELISTGQGVRIVIARTDRQANLDLHNQMVSSVAEAIS